MKEEQSRLKNFAAIPAMLLLFVWCFQLAVPALCPARSAQKCAMPCCLLQVQNEAPSLDGGSQPAASCCQAPAAPLAEHAQSAAPDGQACSAKFCSQSLIFLAVTESQRFAPAENGIKYLPLEEERATVKYFAELFRPPRLSALS